MGEISVRTTKEREVVDITEKVEKAVSECKKRNGICLVQALHGTAGIIVNEHEPNIAEDYLKFFRGIAPAGDWKHNSIDANAEAHLLGALIGAGKCLPVREGKLLRGTWQSIMLVELDGPRSRRRVIVEVVGE